MSKVLFSMVAALCVAVSSVNAAEGISADTLNAMGLSGLKIMSDSEGLAVRGMGLDFDGCAQCERGLHLAAVSGNSFATMNLEGCPDCVPIGGSSHSENAYISVGEYYAAGTNFSEAGASYSTVESVDVGGVVTTLTKTTTARVFAGGFSTARAF
jgi:hypothetical protein